MKHLILYLSGEYFQGDYMDAKEAVDGILNRVEFDIDNDRHVEALKAAAKRYKSVLVQLEYNAMPMSNGQMHAQALHEAAGKYGKMMDK